MSKYSPFDRWRLRTSNTHECTHVSTDTHIYRYIYIWLTRWTAIDEIITAITRNLRYNPKTKWPESGRSLAHTHSFPTSSCCTWQTLYCCSRCKRGCDACSFHCSKHRETDALWRCLAHAHERSVNFLMFCLIFLLKISYQYYRLLNLFTYEINTRVIFLTHSREHSWKLWGGSPRSAVFGVHSVFQSKIIPKYGTFIFIDTELIRQKIEF